MQPQPVSIRLRKLLGSVLDHPWWLVGVAVAVGFVLWLIGTREQSYDVRAQFQSAFNLVSGLPVDVDGVQVGMISGVQYVDDGNPSGGAIVTIGISDHQYYPLHVGTTVESRWGSTIGNGTRRLDLVPGPSSAPEITNGGIIQERDTTAAVDLDQVLNVLTPKRRAEINTVSANMKDGLSGEAPAIQQTLTSAPTAFGAADDVLSDMAANTYALRGLVAGGDRLTSTLAQEAPSISQLVNGAGVTFTALAQHAEGIEASLQAAPGALTNARQTLVQLDGSVDTLTALMTDLRPGADELAPLAVALKPTLSELHSLVPTAVATLQQATTAGPTITKLLSSATPMMSQLGLAMSQLAPMVACIRPYAPELGDALESGAEWMGTYVRMARTGTPGVTMAGGQTDPTDPNDVDEHGVRAMPEASLAADHADVGLSTKEFIQLAGKDYAQPRPPGLSTGQPWFLPQCGAGENALNPSDDPTNPIK